MMLTNNQLTRENRPMPLRNRPSISYRNAISRHGVSPVNQKRLRGESFVCYVTRAQN